MEEKLFDEIEEMENTFDLGDGQQNNENETSNTDVVHEIVCYDDDEDDDEDDSENGIGKLLVTGLVVGGFVLGSWAGPKIKKGVVDGFNWVKNKFSKEKPNEEVIDVEVESEK